jgi:folylpolyglutamate synthase/dihydropteroate synthase
VLFHGAGEAVVALGVGDEIIVFGLRGVHGGFERALAGVADGAGRQSGVVVGVAEGIARVQWPGRLERIAEHPTVFLDGTHNAAGARELAAFWDEHLAGRRIHLVYGSVRDKSVDEIAGLLFPRAARVTVTAPGQPRALSAEALAEMTEHLAPEIDVVADASEAVARALEDAARGDVVFVTGSLYLVGEISKWWKSGAAHARIAAKQPA